jgi:hypothetical protein
VRRAKSEEKNEGSSDTHGRKASQAIVEGRGMLDHEGQTEDHEDYELLHHGWQCAENTLMGSP